MELSVLLSTLKQNGVALDLDGEKLRVTAPSGAVTSEIADAIKRHKPDLVKILSDVSVGSGAVGAPDKAVDRKVHTLSPPQERNLYAAQNGPGLATAYIIRGPLNAKCLERVLDRIVERHAPLRSVLRAEEGGFVVVVKDHGESKLAYHDFTQEVSDITEAEWKRSDLRGRIVAVSSKPFPLEEGPLYRFHLYKVNDEEHILGIFFSQMVFDGTSFDLFVKEMTEGYTALSQGLPWPFPPLQAEYADFVQWKRRRVADRSAEICAWWKRNLGTELPASPIPTDHPRPAIPDHIGLRLPILMPTDFSDSIRKVAKGNGVTTQMVLLGAAFILESRISGRRDCFIATPVEGRKHPVFEPLIGSFVDMILLRYDLNPDMPFRDFLKRLRDYCATAYDMHDLPIESLGLRLERRGDGARPPLFQMEFSYQHVAQRNTMMGPLSISQVDIHGGGTANELCLWVKDWGHIIDGAFEFATSLFDEATAAHWLACYLGILCSVAENPDVALGAIDALNGEKPRADAVMRMAVGSLLESRPSLRGIDADSLRLIDLEGGNALLGAWAKLVSNGRVLIDGVRLKTDGTWETRYEATRIPEADRSSCRVRIGPSDQYQAVMLKIWRDVLGRDDFGVDEDFFDLGGHSILAVDLVRKMNQDLGGRWTLRDIFESPTIEKLSERRGAALSVHDDRGDETSIPVRDIREPALLSPEQERLWFLHELEPDLPLYNLLVMARIDGPCSHDVLLKAMRRVFDRHETFRTAIIAGADGPELAFVDREAIPIRTIDLRSDGREEAYRRMTKEIRAQSTKPIDLSRYPIFGADLYCIADDEHYVSLLMPHVFSDGWSIELFCKELAAAYSRVEAGIAEPPSPRIQYSDYASWARKKKAERAGIRELGDFWRRYLEGIPEVHSLPLDHPRPSRSTGRGDAVRFSVPKKLGLRIKAACARDRVTPFVFFLSSLAYLIWKSAPQETVVIGTPYANREREELKGVFGYFARTIPLRIDIDPAQKVGDWIGYVKGQFLEAFARSEMGLDEIVELIGAPRQLSANPIYQALFAYQSYIGAKEDGERNGLRVSSASIERGIADTDLSLFMWEKESFEGAIEYSTDLFERETMELFASNLLRAMSGLADDGAAPLLTLSLVDEQARKLVDEGNATDRPELLGRTYVEMFRSSSSRRNFSTALRFKGRDYSYGLIDAASDAIALRLANEGIAAGERVGVFLDRGPCLVAALLGVMKAACAYVPLDPRFPAERLRMIVEDSNARVILTEQSLAADPLFGLVSSTRLAIDGIMDKRRPGSTRFGGRRVGPSDIAYVLFTSGSTGRPKGVAITHGALANLLGHAMREPGISERDRVLAVTTPSFDISCIELHLPLACGAMIVMADSETSLDSRDLAALIDREKVSFVQATPSRMSMLFESGWKARPGMKLVAGGEALTRGLVCKMLETGAEVWNGYGPTETAIYSSMHRVTDADKDAPIGKPIANTRFYVLDEGRRLLPPGIQGELAIGGAGLSPGYVGREDLTRERFVELAGLRATGPERVYLTGDLVIRNRSGVYRYFGRNDCQVKIRGYRVELGEIESLILGFPGVKESVCSVWAKSERDTRIVAYYRSESPLDESALKDLLKSRLTEYMVPAYFVRLDQFPRTPSGKVDRKALPPPSDGEIVASGRAEMPRNSIQAVMRKIWKDVLGTDGFGITDSFFDVGGHSLLAAKLIREMNGSFGPHWTLRDLFETPTIEGLSLKAEGDPLQRNVAASSLGLGGRLDDVIVDRPIAITLKEGEPGRAPLICLFGVHLYADIAAQINDGTPVIGLHIPIMYVPGRVARPSLDLVGRHYLEAVKAICPTGPYRLAGFCFGGVTAYHVAMQLERQGEDVELVVAIDSVLPDGWHFDRRIYVSEHLKRPLKSFSSCVAKAKTKVGALVRRRNRDIGQLIDLPVGTEDAWAEIKVFIANRPRLEAPLLLFRATRPAAVSPWNVVHPDMGWTGTASSIRCHDVESDHLGILRLPFASTVASAIQEVLG